MISRRIQQLGSAVIDVQRKLNHEIKEREVDENALSNRYENSMSLSKFYWWNILCTFQTGVPHPKKEGFPPHSENVGWECWGSTRSAIPILFSIHEKRMYFPRFFPRLINRKFQ